MGEGMIAQLIEHLLDKGKTLDSVLMWGWVALAVNTQTDFCPFRLCVLYSTKEVRGRESMVIETGFRNMGNLKLELKSREGKKGHSQPARWLTG